MIGWLSGGRTGRVRALVAGFVALVVVAGAVLAVVLLTTSSREGTPGEPRTATIGIMAPLSGDLAPIGEAVRNAVRLAVDEANSAGMISGWKIRVSVQDDLSRPDGGARSAGVLASDESVIGVVGPLSSTVSMVALPTLDAAGVAVLSPSNSRPELTGAGTSSVARTRPYRTYFRLSGTDELAARAAAEYAVRTLGRARIAVVDGGPDFGTSLAERFAAEVRQRDATVTGVYRVDGSTDDGAQVQEVALRLRADSPDLVYVATGYAFAVKLRAELAETGPAVTIMGSDGLFDSRYLRRTQDTSEGDLVVDLAAPLSRLPGAAEFAPAYLDRWGARDTGSGPAGSRTPGDAAGGDGDAGRSAGGTDGAGTDGEGTGGGSTGGTGTGGGSTSGAGTGGGDAAARPAGTPDHDVIPPVAAYAYDAATALLRAGGTVLPGRTQVDAAARAAIVDAVGRGVFPGVTGDVGFDAWGDAPAPAVSVYAVRSRTFVPVWVHRP